MDMDILLASILVATLTATICGSGLLGWRMWLRSKTERLQLSGRDDGERIAEALDALHERVQYLQDEITELNERVDFAERLLSRGSGAAMSDTPDQIAAT